MALKDLGSWRRVIGSGTVLDTARFRYLLGEHLGVDPRNVHAYVVSEHGDSAVPVWSLANVAGMALDDFCRREECELGRATRARISQQVRDAAYEIIQRKGATYYAVAVGSRFTFSTHCSTSGDEPGPGVPEVCPSQAACRDRHRRRHPEQSLSPKPSLSGNRSPGSPVAGDAAP